MMYVRGQDAPEGQNFRLPTACVLTIGKFESIHRGHQFLIAETRRLAARLGLPVGVVTFDPHPARLLGQPDYKPLFTPAERARILEKLSVDYLLEYPFDATLAEMAPSDFCDLLFDHLQARALVVGEHFCFGRNRAGTAATLAERGRTQGVDVCVLPHCTEDGQKISTSDIRALLTAHAMEEAARWLGFSFFSIGRVEQGRQIGRTLGFPTVNVTPGPVKWLPPDGVYATRTHCDGQAYRSVTNVGVRPTVSGGGTHRTVESFLLDFHRDVYGKELTTEFLTFLRPEQRFDSLAQLQAQITRDIASV